LRGLLYGGTSQKGIRKIHLCFSYVAIALGGEGDRQWVKDFGASDKSQAVYELAAWLDSLGLKLTVENVQKVDR
jgi:hypothetical protein